LKSGLKVTQDHAKWYHSKARVRFLLTLCSNYGAILYRLRDIATYWSKIATLLYPNYIRPRRGWPRRNFATMFDIRKTRMIGLPCGEETMTIC